jgi:transcriptional regulator with XRE-family HTH domain
MSTHDENRFAPGSIAMTKRDKFLAALGNKIRAKRKKKRFSQETLAEKSGMHRTYVADIERGARNVSFVNLIALAAALGITLSGLMNGLEQTVKRPTRPKR